MGSAILFLASHTLARTLGLPYIAARTDHHLEVSALPLSNSLPKKQLSFCARSARVQVNETEIASSIGRSSAQRGNMRRPKRVSPL